ncbi:L-alanine-DL-glutamate epimerase [Clostridium sp. MCC353]|uniref:mandelate racemase/muconate lactonizing enzyme family protein n=1 Tax=Clostridium sp. MCC353 TaxID=2592646 RepID=UPI001C00BF0C|nr:enolase C-terminal domain-like protein [Clostridium sp. MCC353]MBT9779729.1 L-alanine-DL-glutamate epimerase [Clostridium sp. MCC353]
MNEYFSYPDKIRIDRAVFYKIAPIPLDVPFKDGTGNVRNASLFGSWMKIYDEDGVCGQGPCTPLMLNFFVPLLLKEEAKTVAGWREYFYWQIRNFGYQSAHVSEMGSLDMILLDLLANRAGKPLHRFLGADRDWCRVYKGGGSVLLSDEELIEDLVRFKSEGYHQTKFKIGYGTDWGKDIRRLEKARIALGEEFGIAVDANQAWDVETAFAFSKEAAAYRVSWFEEPVHAYDMAGLKQLRDKLDEAGIAMSVAMGESVRSYHTFAGYAEHGVDHLQPGNTRMYCIGENMKVWELAKEKGAMLSSGGFTFQNVVMGTLYGEEAMIEYHQPIMEVLVPYFSVVSEVKDGKFYLPDVPGLPVQMDFEKLERDGLLEEIIIRNRKKNEK